MTKKRLFGLAIVFSLVISLLAGCGYISAYPRMAKKVRNATDVYYDNAGTLALNNADGRAFTDHKQAHAEMVAKKTSEVADAVVAAIKRGGLSNSIGDEKIAFGSNINRKLLEAAALSHDTGMSGSGYALSPLMGDNGKQLKDEFKRKMYEKGEDGKYIVHPEDNVNFSEVRENHSLNSAINVLKARSEYIKAGFTDNDVDRIAAECMAHSKSGSGVSDLNRRYDWSDSFDRIDAIVDAYNADHPEATITFNRSVIEEDDDVFSSVVSETLALRIGDVSRDSWPDAEALSGEIVHVDRATLNNSAGSVEGELENALITIGDKGDTVDSLKSRQVHAGEQNIIDNRTYANSAGRLTHKITVNDGSSAPKCTQDSISDHLEEFLCIGDEKFDVEIVFKSGCDDFAKESYEEFRDIAAGEFENITIHYPWDK